MPSGRASSGCPAVCLSFRPAHFFNLAELSLELSSQAGLGLDDGSKRLRLSSGTPGRGCGQVGQSEGRAGRELQGHSAQGLQVTVGALALGRSCGGFTDGHSILEMLNKDKKNKRAFMDH